MKIYIRPSLPLNAQGRGGLCGCCLGGWELQAAFLWAVSWALVWPASNVLTTFFLPLSSVNLYLDAKADRSCFCCCWFFFFPAVCTEDVVLDSWIKIKGEKLEYIHLLFEHSCQGHCWDVYALACLNNVITFPLSYVKAALRLIHAVTALRNAAL